MEARASPPVLAIGERDGLPLNQRNQALLKNPLKNFSIHCASATPRPIPSRLFRRSPEFLRLRRLAKLERHRSPHDSRLPLAALRKRIEQDVRCPLAGRSSVPISLVGPGGSRRSESSGTGGNSKARQKAPASSDDRGNDLSAGWKDARSRILSRTRPPHPGIALRLRHSQLGAYRHQSG